MHSVAFGVIKYDACELLKCLFLLLIGILFVLTILIWVGLLVIITRGDVQLRIVPLFTII